MRCAVFVAKHNDGFATFGAESTPDSLLATPYGKDVAREFADACRRQGLAFCWRIAPKDWKHPDFGTASHDRYNAYYERVVRELATRYGPLAVMWFDGTEGATSEQWGATPGRIRAVLHDLQPRIMLSNHGGAPHDFVSVETMVGPFDRVHPWETTEPINPSGWVYDKPMPTRPFRELLRNLVHTVGRDGNYLLDVGPMPDGRLYLPDAERLGEFAAWMRVNAEGIHGKRGGPYRGGDWGASTCRGRSVYLFVSDRVGSRLALPALPAAVKAATRLDGGPLAWRIDDGSISLAMADRATESARPVFVGVRLDLDRAALDLPVVDGQRNLATAANTTPSAVREGDTWGIAGLFDADGESAWDIPADSPRAAIEVDLGAVTSIGALAFAQRSQPEGWNQWFRCEVQARDAADAPWRTVHAGHGPLGGPPVLELDEVRARFVRVDFVRPRPDVPLQLAEFCVFAPLP
jgi:alpha-L-fucosidase